MSYKIIYISLILLTLAVAYINVALSAQSAQCTEALSDVSSAKSDYLSAENAFKEADQTLYVIKEKWLPELESAEKRLTEATESLQKYNNEIILYENELNSVTAQWDAATLNYAQSVADAISGTSGGTNDIMNNPGGTHVKMIAGMDRYFDISNKIALAKNKCKAAQSIINLANRRIDSAQKHIASAQEKHDSLGAKKDSAMQELISAQDKASRLCSECEQKYCENTRMYEIDCPK